MFATSVSNSLTGSAAAGNASLMSPQLRHTLVDHAAGNYRILVSMAAELLMTAAQREITTLDEKLYLQVFAAPERSTARRAPAPRAPASR